MINLIDNKYLIEIFLEFLKRNKYLHSQKTKFLSYLKNQIQKIKY